MSFSNSNDATKYLIKKCRNYCTENNHVAIMMLLNLINILEILVIKDAMCKRLE